MNVEPRKYRFRILDASNARFYHLQLVESSLSGRLLDRPGPVFHQIGSDGGLFPAPVTLSDITIAPAERFDVIIDFSGLSGKYFVMTNDAPAPFDGGGEVVPPVVMQFRVTQPGGADTSSLPATLAPFSYLNPAQSVRTRDLIMTEADDPVTGEPIIGLLDNLHWDDPVTENPRAGSIEDLAADQHDGRLAPEARAPGRVPDPRPAAVRCGRLQRDRHARSSRARKWRPIPTSVRRTRTSSSPRRDTSRASSRSSICPTGTNVIPGHRYRYIWHCHILEHEDNEMMRPYDVVG